MKILKLRVFILLLIVFFPCQIWADFALKWKGPENLEIWRYYVDGDTNPYKSNIDTLCDVDGDGNPEICLYLEGSGQFFFYDSKSFEEVWNFNSDSYNSNVSTRFCGFARNEITGKGHAIFWFENPNSIIAVDPQSNNVVWELTSSRLIGICDIDGYSGDELIIKRVQNNTIFTEIWGDDSSGQTKKETLKPVPYNLSQNYPNPFNPDTTIHYDVQTDAEVALTIYNTSGQLIKTLVDEKKLTGTHTVRWDGKNQAGVSVATGVYFYQLQVDDFISSKKMIMLK